MRARSERLALLLIALAHLAAQVTHGSSHIAAEVPITAAQFAFIIAVVTLLPLLAVAVAFQRDVRSGAELFAASMLASFAFGYLFHFVVDTADLHSNVVGEHSGLFFHSALSLALIEFRVRPVGGGAARQEAGKRRCGVAGGEVAAPAISGAPR